MMITSAMVNIVCAAISEPMPIDSAGGSLPSGQIAASQGLIASNTVTSAISVAMPMTMPGIITAM